MVAANYYGESTRIITVKVLARETAFGITEILGREELHFKSFSEESSLFRKALDVSVPLLASLKTSENLLSFWYFQGV